MLAPAPSRRSAVGYIRVSTSMQVLSGHSLDEQRSKIAEYCSLYELDLVQVFSDEGISGKTLKREGLSAALASLQMGAAKTLVVVKLDRLTRNVRDLGVLIETYFGEAGADLASVSEQIDTATAAGRLTLNILTSVAQWEREVITERISSAMQHMKTQGKRTGYVPFGKKLCEEGVYLLADEEEQEIIDLIRSKRAQGLSLRKLADWLNDQGIRNRGRSWSHMTVKSKL